MLYELYLYSINGKLISKEQLAYPVQDMIIKDDHCVLAVLVNSTVRSRAASEQPETPTIASSHPSSPTSKIVIKEIFE